MKEVLIAGNTFTKADLDKLQSIKASIEELKSEIDNKSYYSFYNIKSMVDDGVVVPKTINRDEYLTMVYAHIISEFNKLSVFTPPATEE